MPETHVAGDYTDIIYEYEARTSYPKHSLLLEVALVDGNNQRRMEIYHVLRLIGLDLIIHSTIACLLVHT
ncbi:AlwI family type II restriction endonuclease [Campylobacter concisus]|uniref:AlwI family type II restriction endonuclease n=1 Tax=Campylobacter concisus TaxID=199 RepID=UPI001CA47229